MTRSENIKRQARRGGRISQAEKVSLSERLFSARLKREADKLAKAAHLAAGDGVITERTKITQAAPIPDRWAADVLVGGGFSSLPPGKYAFAAKRCAAKACGGSK